jgi:hypothetical protein
MKTYGANAIAETFERDRGVVVRALRNTPPDAVVSGRPQWKLATASRALERHNRANDHGNGGTAANPPPEYAAFDQAYQAVTALPTLAKRRAAALKTIPLLNDMIRALRAHGRNVGEDPEVTGMRADRVYQLALIGFRAPCEWDHDEVWKYLNIDTDADAAA